MVLWAEGLVPARCCNCPCAWHMVSVQSAVGEGKNPFPPSCNNGAIRHCYAKGNRNLAYCISHLTPICYILRVSKYLDWAFERFMGKKPQKWLGTFPPSFKHVLILVLLISTCQLLDNNIHHLVIYIFNPFKYAFGLKQLFLN